MPLAVSQPAPIRARPLGRPLERPSPYVLIAAGSLVLAAVTLALASVPAYDPWAWITWGREVLHLDLVTTGGPTWKPLPVLFTTLFAPFGSAAPGLWLLVARAGGLAAAGLSSVLAIRLAPWHDRRAQIAAGALAPLGLLALSHYALSVAQGESEGLLVALVLLAILRHLDGAPRHALWFGFAAALIRPETWPFLALYGVWIWRRDPAARWIVLVLFAAVPALWFLPELWGSGSAIRGVQWAQYARAGSPAFARCPFCSELTRQASPMLVGPVKVGLILALLAAGIRTRLLLACAVAWIVEDALLTQMGFSGSDRYLIAPVAVLIVVGAIGWAAAARGRLRAALALGVAVASVLLLPAQGPHFGVLAQTLRFDSSLRAEMASAVAQAGGATRLLVCGPVQTNPSQAPLAAWTLGTELLSTESSDAAVRIQSPNAPGAKPLPAVPRGYRLVAASGAVRIYSACG